MVKYLCLIGINFIYALVVTFSKLASTYTFLSIEYCACLLASIMIMVFYAISWQQIIKRMPISEAYMFKGTSIVFVLLLSALLFGEGITLLNITGSAIIILGIALFAKSDKKV